ncbi:MAG: outer membrane protein transport protein [Candidatus Lernaella stagnicola]|nr:outer membrane protein transport protein [Candidatus Lernaella stagnicola]
MRRRAFLHAAGVLLLSCVVLLPSGASASGFFHPEVGARNFARGGAAIAGGTDLACFYVNMANLAQLDGTNIYGNAAFDVFHTYYRREPYLPAVRNSNPFDPIQFMGISSDFGLDSWTFGFAVYGPYGVTNRWPEKGPQRYNIIEANVLQIYYSLGVAWNPKDWIRVGVKGSVVNFKLLNFYGFTVLGDRNQSFDVTAKFLAYTEFVPSWGAGIVLAPIPNWVEVGFSYLPEFNVTVLGEVVGEMPQLYGVLLGGRIFSDDLTLPIHYPPIYRVGTRFIYKDKGDFELALMYIPWSYLQYYDIDLEGEEVMQDFKFPLNWKDTWNYRAGGTYKFNDHWWIHGGYQFEQTANPEWISGLETDRHIVSTGLTVRYFGMDIDFGYGHVFQDDVDTPPPPPTFESELDDGRGRYKSSYDVFLGAINFNIERMYYAYHGRRPW